MPYVDDPHIQRDTPARPAYHFHWRSFVLDFRGRKNPNHSPTMCSTPRFSTVSSSLSRPLAFYFFIPRGPRNRRASL